MRKKLVIACLVLGLSVMACAGLSFNLPSAGDIVSTALATNGLGEFVEMATMLATSGFGDDAQSMVETMMAGGGGDAQSMVETMMAGGTGVPMETLMAGFSDLQGGVLFQDDFSDTSSGWDRNSSEQGATDYIDGGYHIFVAPENYSVWANPGQFFTDVRVGVDAHKLSGVDDNEYGVICRYEDTGNFYAASVSSDGYYGVIDVDNGEFQYVGMEGMQPTDQLNLGDGSNHVQLDCVGSTLTLSVNGVQLVSVEDDSHASGDVGLYAGTFNSPNIDIFFDNFVASQP
jgi:hypothetical protein